MNELTREELEYIKWLVKDYEEEYPGSITGLPEKIQSMIEGCSYFAWFPVSKCLPPPMQEVLLFGLVDGVKKDILLGYIDGDHIWHTTYMVYADSLLNTITWQLTHWMHLPEYPK